MERTPGNTEKLYFQIFFQKKSQKIHSKLYVELNYLELGTLEI